MTTMTTKNNKPADAAPRTIGVQARAQLALRQRAEAMLRKRAAHSSGYIESMTREEPDRMLHELHLHQIELEMQNQTLMAAQIAAEESRDRFVDFYEFAPVGYITLTDRGLIADINQTGAALLGAKRGKLLRQPFARYVSPDDADRWHLHFVSVMKRDGKLNCDLALHPREGVPAFVRLDSLRLARDGQALTVRVVLTDITERKQAERELAASVAELRMANDNIKLAERAAKAGAYNWNFKTGEAKWSTEFLRLFGFDASNYKASYETWQAALHPDDRQKAEMEVAEAIRDRKSFAQEYRVVLPGGGTRWIAGHGDLLCDDAGLPQSLIGFCIDITEHKHAEAELTQHHNELEAQFLAEQLNAIFALSPDAFVSFDSALCVKSVNLAFSSLTGLNHTEILGLDEAAFSERLSGVCLPQAKFSGLSVLRALKKGNGAAASLVSARTQKIEIAGAGNRVLEIRLHESPGANIAQILLLRDVTHETEVERLKSEFVSTAAHELRTPMVSIFGFTELLLTQNFSEAQRKDFLETVFKQSQLIISIINEMLDLSSIEARRGKDFIFENVNLRVFVPEIAAHFKVPTGRAPPEELPANGDLWVRTDRDKLNQALCNVLSNAYKFSPAGGPIGIEFVHPVPGTPLVGIRIIDRGIGMTPEQCGHISERFYHADLSGKISGAGLGMSILSEIVMLLSGEVTIDSKLGAGTTVTIWIPTAANALSSSEPGLDT